MFADPDRSMKC